MTSSRSLRVLAFAVVAVAVVACTKTLDTDGLEGDLRSQIQEQIGSPITSVDCPSDIEVEAGGTFTCTAQEDSGTSFTVRITQTDDKGSVAWDLVDAAA